jgi:hypothetical protein
VVVDEDDHQHSDAGVVVLDVEFNGVDFAVSLTVAEDVADAKIWCVGGWSVEGSARKSSSTLAMNPSTKSLRRALASGDNGRLSKYCFSLSAILRW